MDTTQTIEKDAPSSFTVEILVHHGDYKATFTGTGSNILEAAEEAARQTTYANGLFDTTSSHYGERAVLRTALEAALTEGRSYSGFGWITFKLIDSASEQDSIPDPVDAALASGDLQKLVSEELLEKLIEAHAVAVRKDSIRLFPQTYSETTSLEPFRIEARRTLTRDLESLEYAYAALQLQE